MANGINKVIIIGNVTKDPESKATNTGAAVTTFSVATNEAWNDKSGQKQERVEFHDVVMFGKLAEISAQYVKRGSLIYLEGKIQTDSWDDKESGQKRYRTKIYANQMQLLGGKSDSNRQSNSQPVSNSNNTNPSDSVRSQPAQDNDFTDDIPF